MCVLSRGVVCIVHYVKPAGVCGLWCVIAPVLFLEKQFVHFPIVRGCMLNCIYHPVLHIIGVMTLA